MPLAPAGHTRPQQKRTWVPLFFARLICPRSHCHQWKDSMLAYASSSRERQPTWKITVETVSPSSSISSTSEKGCSQVGQLLLLPIHCDMQPKQKTWPQFGMHDRFATSTSGASQSPQRPRPPSPAAAIRPPLCRLAEGSIGGQACDAPASSSVRPRLSSDTCYLGGSDISCEVHIWPPMTTSASLIKTDGGKFCTLRLVANFVLHDV